MDNKELQKKKTIMKRIRVFIIFTVILFLAGARIMPVFAYVMESADYRIQRDSINIGGGDSTSTDYSLQDTVGEAGTGIGTSTSFNLYAGYQQMDAQKYLSLTPPDSTTLSPSISGLYGGIATGSSDVGVRTNNYTGYTLSINASTSPAMVLTPGGADSFSDYTPAGSAPDFTWSIPSSSSAFGFSPQGPDIITRYLDNGSSCNQAGGTDTPNACWDGFSTSPRVICQSDSSNDPAGSTTTISMQAQSGSQRMQRSGTYQSSLTVTAYMN